jgi:hypothetical protein
VKQFFAFLSFLLLSLPAFAAGGNQVKYFGGTVQNLSAGVTGVFEVTSDSALVFQHAGNKLSIPYSSIHSSAYSKDVARHLGILPAIVVALLRARQHRHFFRISYQDEKNVEQLAIFEVPKAMPRVLSAVLATRAPLKFKSCVPCGDQP